MGSFSASKLELKVREALAAHASAWSCCSRGEDAAKSNPKNDFLEMLGLERGEYNEGGPNAQDRVCCWLPDSSWAGSYHQTSTLIGSQGWKGPQKNLWSNLGGERCGQLYGFAVS